MKQFLVIFLFFFLPGVNLFGKIILPSVFADNMVLQQNSDVAIWGWSRAGETIKIVCSWNSNDTIKVKADNTSAWKTTIRTISAGGPYTIGIFGSSNLLLRNVMLGEVWICSGQSNMECTIDWKITNGEEEAVKANNPNIRIFHVERIGAEFPQQTCHATWTVCSPETMRSTSAIGYFFAKTLQYTLNIPVGIIVSAWGSTPAEVWIEKSRIENNPKLNSDKYKYHSEWAPEKPGTLYNSMIAPISPFGISGAIWYQGETNRCNYQIYSQLMKTLIENWRSDFKKDFPFYMVQIAPYDYGGNGKSEYIREQQDIVAKTVPNTGLIVISDLVDDIKEVHPKNKIDVGKRLANYALAEIYKQNLGGYKSPSFESMVIEKDKIRITFSNAGTGLKCTGSTSLKFLISGDDHHFIPAVATIKGNIAILSSKLVNNPVAVRFCFDDASLPDVFSAEGLPLAPFRTDTWEK